MKNVASKLAILCSVFCATVLVCSGCSVDTAKDISTYPVTYVNASYSVDRDDLHSFLEEADYVFVGHVDAMKGTTFGYTDLPETKYEITVLENLKSELVTGVPIPMMKTGGVDEGNGVVVLETGDFLPEVGKDYIFLAYAQENGSLLIVGYGANVPLDDTEAATTRNAGEGFKQSPTFQKYAELARNAQDTKDFTSDYDAAVLAEKE